MSDRQAAAPEEREPGPEQAAAYVSLGKGARSGDINVALRDQIITIVQNIVGPLPVVTGILTVALLAGLAGSAGWLLGQPARMGGDFDVAVAEFYESQGGTPARSDLAGGIGRRLRDDLSVELGGFDLEVHVAHRNVRYVEDETDAEELALRIGAELLIFGSVEHMGNTVSLKPRFYVMPEIRGTGGRAAAIAADVDELTSSHAIDFPLNIDPDRPEDLIAEVETRALVISDFTQGVMWLIDHKPERARAPFASAIERAESLKSVDGLEVLYLFAGVAGYQAGAYRAAIGAVDRALEIAPGYSRAQIARANIYYNLAVDGIEGPDGCREPAIDDETARLCAAGRNEDAWWYLAGLAHEGYRRAAEAEPAPEEYRFYASEKGWLGAGNVKLMYAQISPEYSGFYEEAIKDFQRVANAYLDTPARYRPAKAGRAAQAYWGIGVASENLGRRAEAREAYRRCVDVKSYDDEVQRECQTYLDGLTRVETDL